MSRQLTQSALFCVLATVAMILSVHTTGPRTASREATAHGTLFTVLLGV